MLTQLVHIYAVIAQDVEIQVDGLTAAPAQQWVFLKFLLRGQKQFACPLLQSSQAKHDLQNFVNVTMEET